MGRVRDRYAQYMQASGYSLKMHRTLIMQVVRLPSQAEVDRSSTRGVPLARAATILQSPKMATWLTDGIGALGQCNGRHGDGLSERA